MSQENIFPSSEEMEKKLRSVAYPIASADLEFQKSLGQKLLTKRVLQRDAPSKHFAFGFWKIFVPAAATLAVILLVVVPFIKTPEPIIEIPQEIEQKPIPVESLVVVPPKKREIPPLVLKKNEFPKTSLEIPKPSPSVSGITTGSISEKSFVEDFSGGEGESEAEGFGREESAAMAPQALSTEPSPHVTLFRTYYDLDGNPDIQEGEKFIIAFSFTIDSSFEAEDFIISDELPGGFVFDEFFVNDLPSGFRVEGQKIFITFPGKYEKPPAYFARASSKGNFVFQPAAIELVRDPEIYGFSGKMTVEVR